MTSIRLLQRSAIRLLPRNWYHSQNLRVFSSQCPVIARPITTAAGLVGCSAHHQEQEQRFKSYRHFRQFSSELVCDHVDLGSDLSSRPVRILWGSQGGTARMFAQQLEESLLYGLDGSGDPTEDGRSVSVEGLHEAMDAFESPSDSICIILISVTGVGEPPDNARKFFEWVTDSNHDDSDLSGLKYAVFGLGNATAHPNHFNVIGKAIDESLASRGAQRIIPIGLGDDGGCIEDDYDEWMYKLHDKITSVGVQSDGAVAEPVETESPFTAVDGGQIILSPDVNVAPGQRRLSSKYPELQLIPSKSQEVREDLFHLQGTSQQFYQDDTVAVDVIRNTLLTANAGESGLHEMRLVAPQPYETGDHLIVYPRNSQCMVEAYLDTLDGVDWHATIEADDKYPHPTGITVYETFSHCLDLGAVPSPSFARTLLGKSELNYKEEIAEPRRTVLDLILESGNRLSLEDLLYNMSLMKPRYYSIASSNICHPNEIALTFRPVKYVTSRGALREGVATSYLSHKGVIVDKGSKDESLLVSRVAAKVNHNPTFRLPKDPKEPIMMLAGGCGVAPIRAFVEERVALSQQENVEFGPGRLYLGFRNRSDEVYRSLIQSAVAAGTLTHAEVAYATGNCANTGQLTDLLQKDAQLVWEHLNGGGYTFLCGGARTFGAAMERELLNIIQERGGMDFEEASDYMRKLAAEGRLCEDLAD